MGDIHNSDTESKEIKSKDIKPLPKTSSSSSWESKLLRYGFITAIAAAAAVKSAEGAVIPRNLENYDSSLMTRGGNDLQHPYSTSSAVSHLDRFSGSPDVAIAGIPRPDTS